MPGESQRMPSSEADPSVLTTEQLLREVDRVKELMTSELSGMEDVFVERLSSVEKQFNLIERQRVEQKADTEKAVAAALQAAKEAVQEQTAASDKSITKSETATAEQLKQLTATFTTAIGGVTDGLNDLKERVGNIEAVKQGASETKAELSANAVIIIGVLSLLVAALGIVVVVILANA